MKKVLKFVFLFVVLVFFICFSGYIRAFSEDKIYCEATVEDDFTVNEIIVTLNKNYNDKQYVEKDFKEVDCLKLHDLTYELGKIKTGINRIFKLNVSSSSKKELLSKIHELEKRNDIYSASPNFSLEFSSFEVNDSRIDEQWGLNAISPYDVWENITTGSSTVNVGIVDSGIDGTHPDLIDNIDTNLSVDFSRESVVEGAFDPLVDKVGHGTHVAGVIGAVGNNAIGVSGVCWNVNLISIKISNSMEFELDSLIGALQYAELQQIPLLNLSLVCKMSYASLQEAVANYSGLIVCAAGNDGNYVSGSNSYPSNYQYDHILSVGASNQNKEKCSFSNFSKNHVDVFAPGYEILSTYPLSLDSSGYKALSGTSMATPFVTGLAALLMSYNPSMSKEDIKAAIIGKVQKTENLKNYCVSGGIINIEQTFNYFTHVHNYRYVYRDKKFHILTCYCGSTKGKLEVHVVSTGDVKMPFAFCMDCHARLDLREDIGEGILSLSPKRTKNGSYYLSSGILVLADADKENYYSDNLIFGFFNNNFLSE